MTKRINKCCILTTGCLKKTPRKRCGKCLKTFNGDFFKKFCKISIQLGGTRTFWSIRTFSLKILHEELV